MSGESVWVQLYTLARRARLASATHQPVEIRLSPEEGTVLADVLEAALRMISAITGGTEWDRSEPGFEKMALPAMEGGAFDWLADEPDLYSDDDLKERFEWPAV